MRLTFKEAILLAREVGIKDERTNDKEVILDLEDGSSLHFESNYDGPCSGIEPPSVYLVKK